VHERGHPLGQPADIVVDLLDLTRLHAQHRVAVLANPGEREHAPGLKLELLLVRGVIVLPLVLVVVLVVVVAHRAASLDERVIHTRCRDREGWRRGARRR